MNRFHRWYCQSKFWQRTLEQRLAVMLKDTVLGDKLLEIGPGPGLTTDILRHHCSTLTAVEIDPELADRLHYRMQGTNVTVVPGDATSMPFEDASFSGAVAITMLHHVPSADLQNRLLTEVHRVLRPGGIFLGTDSKWSRTLALMHLFDTMVLVDPSTFAARLQAAGFTDIIVDDVEGAFRFRAQRPEVWD